MFNIGMMELVLVLLVAFLVVGPKDLPKVARWIARMVKKARDYIDQFKDEFGLDEIAADMQETGEQLKDAMKDADVSEDVRATQDELRAMAEGLDYDMKKAAKEVEQAVEEK